MTYEGPAHYNIYLDKIHLLLNAFYLLETI